MDRPVDAVAGLLGGILLFTLTACGGPRDPAREALLELRAAAEARDADRFVARLCQEFRGHDGSTRASVAATLRRYFAAYESLSITLHDVQVDPGERSANVRLLAEFSGQGKKAFGLGSLLPSGAVYRFELNLEDEGGVFRVRQASYEVVPPLED